MGVEASRDVIPSRDSACQIAEGAVELEDAASEPPPHSTARSFDEWRRPRASRKIEDWVSDRRLCHRRRCRVDDAGNPKPRHAAPCSSVHDV
jgi:hypothetical protein